MKILIAIHGSHSRPEQMQAQRETWIKDDHWASEYRFFLGAPEGNEDDVTYGDYPDGPIWEGTGRTWHLNRKTEALVQYAFDHDYDYVFKCDDDTYVRTEMLLASGCEEHDYSGSMDTHWTPAIGQYRWAQGGAGYWLSRRAMEVIVDNGLHGARAEDFAVGQILAANGIHPHHDERYKPSLSESELESPEALAGYITLHKVSPEWMRRLHASGAKQADADYI